MNAHTPVLKPYGCPQGVDPRKWRHSVETRRSDQDIRSIGYVLVYAMDILKPVRELLNRERAADIKAFRAAGNA
ncbi:hypothetical protein EOB59_31655 [Mesorhizobium sp. M7A.F.Ca.MR.176.00.0.0]|uniref:hypothetical protein n=1 Tax=Mesorhizobium sp. M7A.F.Ca.MR.176.00.0.0 TaxID=2496776 RepID=UPI000FD19310|nr:hypothetical protein [Mesorhizobium sp. M7A.F.Ca.MR.176.00.0.0]RUU85582.1 hypothetical protein EOB59_31655 [Mesorhizobium sp. M7A.F.Ca.MR.176.00.0.0]